MRPRSGASGALRSARTSSCSARLKAASSTLEHKDDALALRGLGARLLLFTRRRQAADHAWGALWGKTS